MTLGHRAASQDRRTSVATSVTVDVDRERAFAVFTDGIDSWWIRSHHIGSTDLAAVVIEPWQGGRWYEKGVDGSEWDWGGVLLWEPPARVVLAWQLDAEWRYDPALVTEVAVTFTPEAPSRTRVDLEHRHLDRLGGATAPLRASFGSDRGWPGLLRGYAERAASGHV